jgi:hypothetical protein
LVCSLFLKEAVCSNLAIADVFGRVEVVLLSIFFYVLGKSVRHRVRMILSRPGTIIEAVGQNVETFAAGAVFYQVCTVLSADREP